MSPTSTNHHAETKWPWGVLGLCAFAMNWGLYLTERKTPGFQAGYFSGIGLVVFWVCFYRWHR